MIALEVIAALVLFSLLVATTCMALVGLMGAVSPMRLKRCRACGHLVLPSPNQAGLCPYCRHPWLSRHHVGLLQVHHFMPAEMEPVHNTGPLDRVQAK
jgi:RNA polymerase subunit RPABC4/transcription elongation factor Spt4